MPNPLVLWHLGLIHWSLCNRDQTVRYGSGISTVNPKGTKGLEQYGDCYDKDRYDNARYYDAGAWLL